MAAQGSQPTGIDEDVASTSVGGRHPVRPMVADESNAGWTHKTTFPPKLTQPQTGNHLSNTKLSTQICHLRHFFFLEMLRFCLTSSWTVYVPLFWFVTNLLSQYKQVFENLIFLRKMSANLWDVSVTLFTEDKKLVFPRVSLISLIFFLSWVI